MPFDAHKNLAIATVAAAPSPPTSGTVVSLTPGEISRFPAAPFNVTIWPATQIPTPVNAEVARVTAIAGDSFTLLRAQEGTTARSIVAGDLIAATITVKALADLESGLHFPELVAVGQVRAATARITSDIEVLSPGQIRQGSFAAGSIFFFFSGGTLTTGKAGATSEFHTHYYNINGICGGVSTAGSSTIYNTTSDQRLKDDLGVARLDQSQDVLRRTVVHEFTWKADGTPGRGVFAQEAIAVAPFAVTQGRDEVDAAGHLVQPWSVDYSKYIPDLIVGWQHHDTKVAALEATVAALETRLAALEGAAPARG